MNTSISELDLNDMFDEFKDIGLYAKNLREAGQID